MMTEQTLWDVEPPTLRPRQSEVVEALRFLVAAATADDVKVCLGRRGMTRERNEVASRLSELEHLGIVRRVSVKRNHRGRTVHTWALR
jgi:hypothetical protein